MAFSTNCASKNAQKIHVYEELKVELWCDKHYRDRRDFGDDNGKREGIEIEGVQELIVNGFKYLLDIYLRGVRFDFINYNDPRNPNKPFKRIVFTKFLDKSSLNIAAEIHYLGTSKFEITVITAMVVDNFKVGDGQYSLRIDKNSAKLVRNIRREFNEIYKLAII